MKFHVSKSLIMICICLVLYSLSLYAQETKSSFDQSILHPIEKIIEIHKNPNQNLEIWTQVYYPHTCFKNINTQAFVDRSQYQIQLAHKTIQEEGICNQVMKSKLLKTELTHLEQGHYSIFDQYDGARLGELIVQDNNVTFKE